MDVTVDKFGRIVIPKKLRERLGIEAGAKLRLDVEDHDHGQRLAIEPVREKSVIQRRGHLLVHTGEFVDDAADVIKQVREERTRKLMGL